MDGPAPIARTTIKRLDTVFIEGLKSGDTVFFDGRKISTNNTVKETVVTTPRHHHLEIRREGRLFLARELELIPYERLIVDVRDERIKNAGDSIDRK